MKSLLALLILVSTLYSNIIKIDNNTTNTKTLTIKEIVNNKLLKKNELFQIGKNRKSINPNFKIILKSNYE